MRKKESPFDNHPQKIINYDNITNLTEEQVQQKNLQEYNDAMQLSMKDHIHKLDIIMKEQWIGIKENREFISGLSDEMNDMKEFHLKEEDELIKEIINKCQETEKEWKQFFNEEQLEYQRVVKELDELKDVKFIDDQDIIELNHRILDTENILGFRKKI